MTSINEQGTRAVVIFPYSGFGPGKEKKSELFIRLLETTMNSTLTPLVLVVNHDTVAKTSTGEAPKQDDSTHRLSHEDHCREWLAGQLDRADLMKGLDPIFVWSVDTCQMWLHGWGHAITAYENDTRIIQLPGDLSRLSKEKEFFQDTLPAFIRRDDLEIIVGDFRTGDPHSSKDLIDQYGTFPLISNWFPEAARAIMEKPILHPRSEFLNISRWILEKVLRFRAFAYEQTLNMLIQLWETRGEAFWEESVGVHPLGVIEDDAGFRKYRDCLDQIERMERMLKMVWRERNWEALSTPHDDQINRFENLDKRSTSIRETGRIILKSMLGIGGAT